MIEWSKRYVCDNCEVIHTKNNPVFTYIITMGRTREKFELCYECIKEMGKAVIEIIEQERGNHEKERRY